jgi:signal transduction histidine kinase
MAPVRLSPSASRALHRIVQEAVTNALKHGVGPIRVEVSQQDADVCVEIFNSGATLDVPVPGRGLINMRERARLEGGDFSAGPVPGGFRVRASLPAPALVTS